MADASETKQALGGEGAVSSETPVGAAAVAAAKGEGEAVPSSDKGKGKAKVDKKKIDKRKINKVVVLTLSNNISLLL